MRLLSPPSRLDDVLFDVSHYVHERPVDEGEHGHTCIEIAIVVGGRAMHRFNGNSRPAGPGDVFLVLPGNTHCFHDHHRLEHYNISCTADAPVIMGADIAMLGSLREMFRSGRGEPALALGGWRSDDVRRLVQTMHGLHNEPPGEERHVQLRSLFAMFLLLLAQEYWRRTDPEPSVDRRLRTVTLFMDEHYAAPLTVAELARMACLSTSQFIRRFQREYERTPIDYLLDLRLQKARRKLADTDAPVENVGRESGFADGNYFIRLFRRRHGMTPGAYRRAMREAKGRGRGKSPR